LNANRKTPNIQIKPQSGLRQDTALYLAAAPDWTVCKHSTG